jgi:hypothetical protein
MNTDLQTSSNLPQAYPSGSQQKGPASGVQEKRSSGSSSQSAASRKQHSSSPNPAITHTSHRQPSQQQGVVTGMSHQQQQQQMRHKQPQQNSRGGDSHAPFGDPVGHYDFSRGGSMHQGQNQQRIIPPVSGKTMTAPQGQHLHHQQYQQQQMSPGQPMYQMPYHTQQRQQPHYISSIPPNYHGQVYMYSDSLG